MKPHIPLEDRVVVISGASRGIGLSIGKRLGQEGARIAILAKTAEPHPKLPGTIYTAQEEIEKCGAREVLPIVCDIRSEEQVEKAIQQIVDKFGARIDIVVNNASAISLTNTSDTSMKRYDLMHQINGRGTFLLSKTCLPYLKNSDNAHIVNLSPPLDLSPKWFKNHVAYTMSKYNMSLCTLGMSEEFKKYHIAVNSLWPRVAIATSAVQNLLGGDQSVRHSRTPEIVADALYEIVSTPSTVYTGNFFLDEDLLSDKVVNFDKYAVNPGVTPFEDFFLPQSNEDEKHQKQIEESIDEMKPRLRKMYLSSKM